MKLVLQQLPTLRGSARARLLAPDAAASLLSLEKDTGGLVYVDIWRDAVASLLSRRLRKTSQLPSYSPHNYGFAVDLDVKAILDEKKILYEDLIYIMKKRGWFCHRRDGDGTKHEAGHFNYLGDLGERFIVKTTFDPATWQRPAEERIYELYGKEFQISLQTAQGLLTKAGFYNGETTETIDAYTREAILAFQRAWDLVEDGQMSMSFCRCLVFVTADRQVRPSG